MNNIAAVFVGGGLGSLVRYGIASYLGLFAARLKFNFPIATLTSNVLSCAILAITVSVLSYKTDLSPTWRFLIITGFCGGFSTFSAFSYETVELLRSGYFLAAVANILISVSVCMALMYVILTRTIN
jgi:CrcB protein